MKNSILLLGASLISAAGIAQSNSSTLEQQGNANLGVVYQVGTYNYSYGYQLGDEILHHLD